MTVNSEREETGGGGEYTGQGLDGHHRESEAPKLLLHVSEAMSCGRNPSLLVENTRALSTVVVEKHQAVGSLVVSVVIGFTSPSN